MTPAVLLLGAVTVERFAELLIARRNTKKLLAKGAMEVAPRHYPAIVLLHVFWLASLWIFGRTSPLNSAWLVVFLALQILRAWVLITLGSRWTTRIIVLQNAALVAKGPYRIFRHPNYVVVVGEIATLPFCLGLPLMAFAFSVANAILLSIRVRAENAALIGSRHVRHA